MADKTVLVTDDDDYVRRAVARLLRHHDYHVICASSGSDALELVAAAPPAVVLLDVMMPGMDGLETAARLRELHAERCPPIAIMSAGPVNEARLSAIGAVGLLRKPFNTEALLMLIETCTGTARSAPDTARHRIDARV